MFPRQILVNTETEQKWTMNNTKKGYEGEDLRKFKDW